ADREARALDRGHDRLGQARAGEPERIDPTVGNPPRSGCEDLAPLREIEPTGEVIAVREQDADAQLAIALELAVRRAERVPQRKIERVALGHAIEADQEDVAATLDADGAFAHARGIPQRL